VIISPLQADKLIHANITLIFYTYRMGGSIHLLFCVFFRRILAARVSNLRGGAMVAVSDPNRQVVVGTPSCVEPASDCDGSRVLLDVEVFVLITT